MRGRKAGYMYSCHVAIVGVAVGDDVLCDGVDVGGHGPRLAQLAHDSNLIGRLWDAVRDQKLVMILMPAQSLLEVGQMHFR